VAEAYTAKQQKFTKADRINRKNADVETASQATLGMAFTELKRQIIPVKLTETATPD